jgi:hypothetical protein
MDDDIKQLYIEINEQHKINSNAVKFIKYKNITPYKFNKKNNTVCGTDLPIQARSGSIYLIKGNNILHFYSYCDNAFSLHMQFNIHRPMWICKPNIINTEHGDPERLNFLMDGTETIYSYDNLEYLLLDFIHVGFNVYIQPE